MKTVLIRPLVAFIAVILLAGCEKKKESNVIITTRPVEAVKKDTISMKEMSNVSQVSWNGTQYTVEVTREPDKTLPITEDEDEDKYYDNKITLAISRQDGSIFMKKTFYKSDFKSYVSDEYFEKKALVGFVFDKVDKNRLKFAASIGSPDKFSDDFIPFDVAITSDAGVSIKLSETLVESSTSDDDI